MCNISQVHALPVGTCTTSGVLLLIVIIHGIAMYVYISVPCFAREQTYKRKDNCILATRVHSDDDVMYKL